MSRRPDTRNPVFSAEDRKLIEESKHKLRQNSRIVGTDLVFPKISFNFHTDLIPLVEHLTMVTDYYPTRPKSKYQRVKRGMAAFNMVQANKAVGIAVCDAVTHNSREGCTNPDCFKFDARRKR